MAPILPGRLGPTHPLGHAGVVTTNDAQDEMATSAADGRRRWYALESPAALHHPDGRLVSDVVLEVLRDVVDEVCIDAYTDHETELGPQEQRAQEQLRALGTARSRGGDPFMGIELDLDDPVHRALATAYSAWSINTDLRSEQHGREVGCFHDSSLSITLRLTDDEADVVRDSVSDHGSLELLLDLQRGRRARRRARRAAVAAAARRALRR